MIETKFKDTEIGKIPEEWAICDFDNTFTFLSTNTLSRDMLGEKGDVYDIHYGDVLIKYGNILDAGTEGIPCIKEECCYKTMHIVENGDVIIADTAEDETVGKVCEVQNVGSKQIVSGLHTIWVRSKEKRFAPKYLGYAMNGAVYHNQLLPLIQGTKVSSISKAAIKNTYIVIPPLSEQHRIASALTSIDNLISSLAKLIEKKKNIKQGAMQQLLTGKTRLKGFEGKETIFKNTEIGKIPEDWNVTPISKICKVKRGVRVTREQLTDNGKYPVYQNTSYPMGYFDKYNVAANTPFIIVGGSAGLIGLCDKNYWAADDCAYFGESDSLDKMYLYYELRHRQSEIKKFVRTASVPRLDRKVIEEFVLPLPPFSEQRAIATILTKMDDEITALEAKKAKYEAVKQGMMQQLLTGKIRLIG